MTGYEIVDATLWHAYDIRPRLRPLDVRECVGTSGSVRRSLRQSIKRSFFSRAAVVEGRTIAIWGLGGSLVGDEGNPWFLTTPEVERFPVAMVREARRWVGEMLEIRPLLWNYVLADYPQAVKFVSVVGFSLEQPNFVAKNGDLYRRFWMER